MKINCSYQKLVNRSELKEHERNPNFHSDEQIYRLAKIIYYQGIRHPIIINSDNVILAGHGRLKALEKLGVTEIPCDVQDFDSEEQQYAFMTSDNAIASWAELDFSLINEELENLGPDFDVQLLGIENFEIEPFDKLVDSDKVSDELNSGNIIKCPKCNHEWGK